jgi:hypothetical protein
MKPVGTSEPDYSENRSRNSLGSEPCKTTNKKERKKSPFTAIGNRAIKPPEKNL